MSRIADPNTPGGFLINGDANAGWGALPLQVGVNHKKATGADPITGSGGGTNNCIEELANRTEYLKAHLGDASNRGYQGRSIKINSGAISISDLGKIVQVYSGTLIAVTLPSVTDLVSAGTGWVSNTVPNPTGGGVIKPVIVQGKTYNDGSALKINVAASLQDFINIEDWVGDSIYLYQGEWAEFVPMITKNIGIPAYTLTWIVSVHNSNYGKLGKMFITPPIGGNLPNLGLLLGLGGSRISNLSRVKYARLWEALNKSGFYLNGALQAESGVGDMYYGTGNGTTTFSCPLLNGGSGIPFLGNYFAHY